MSLGADVFGYIAGTIGIVAALYAFISSQLPKNQFKYLVEVLEDTESLFQCCIEEGLLTSDNPRSVSRMESRLAGHRKAAEKLRTDALGSLSFSKQFSLMFDGLSTSISRTASDVTSLRGKILSQSDQKRAQILSTRLLRNNRVPSTATPTGPRNYIQQTNTSILMPPPSSGGTNWIPPPRLVAELDVCLHARLRRGPLRRSRTCPDFEDLRASDFVPVKPSSNPREGDTHVRATSGVSTANTLVAEPPTDECRPAGTEENARRCSSPLPLPNCTPLKGSRARSRLHPVRAFHSCCDAILKVLKVRRRR
ncbi:hypothetical protein PLICRDRAFT_170857 [Plicaturopsis crispa FD-325 SS-3]|nr:hypothetical protein PLICRDRAFT_170857 [Plicaturopsis crispa FD-325 SS-3]